MSSKERDAWAQAEEQYRLVVAEVGRQRAEVERLKHQQATMEAQAAVQKEREEHAAWYQSIAECQGGLRPQLEEVCMEARRQRERYKTVKSCVLQSLLFMKAVGDRHGTAPDEAQVEAAAPAEQLAGNWEAPANADAAVRVTGGFHVAAHSAVSDDVGATAQLGYKRAATAHAWHENKAVMTARICARSRTNIENSPPAYISKLLGTRRFKSVKDRPRW